MAKSRFINYKKLQELQQAAENGNEIARNIIDKYMGDAPDMDSIERLMDEYYGNAGIEQLKNEEMAEKTMDVVEEAQEEGEDPEQELVEHAEEFKETAEQPADISEDLDKELDGLIDEDEFEDMSFSDFLGKKKKEGLRAKKNADYFKAFDQGGREAYLSAKKDAFNHGFDNRRRQNERGFNDIDGAITEYSKMVTDMPDDEIGIDVASASKAYDEFTDNEQNMKAFGRSWDASDMEFIKTTLDTLVKQYGKKNVMAVLNTLREDNAAWRKFNDGKIENAVGNYGKALDGLLK